MLKHINFNYLHLKQLQYKVKDFMVNLVDIIFKILRMEKDLMELFLYLKILKVLINNLDLLLVIENNHQNLAFLLYIFIGFRI